MKRWYVTIRRTVETSVTVRAMTEDQARRAAEGYWPDVYPPWQTLADDADIRSITDITDIEE